MSKIETILTRMINEPSFADAVFADIEKALTVYGLSDDETEKFKGMSRADFEAFASASPEERKSFSRVDPPVGSGYFQIRDEGG